MNKLPALLGYSLILSLSIFLRGCTSPNSSPKEEEKTPPNIVIIFTDDQGYQDVGCFGSPDISTPHLDHLARNGVRFTQFYVAQPVCSASRAALMTGCYPSRVSISGAFGPNVKHGLNPEEMTLAELLKPLGYATGIFGKWHLGDLSPFLPTEQGFDEYYGIPYSNDMWPYHPERPENYPPLKLMEGDQVIDTLESQEFITTEYTERAVSFIERNKNNPFFLYLPHSMPHVPLFVSDKFKGKSPRGLYGDVISEIDWSVGQIMEALKKHRLEKNTLVIFTSDNGPWLSYGDHSGSALPLREGKGTTWEGGVRVPAIMSWKGTLPAGIVTDKPAMTIDILPTIAQITGASLPEKPIDGTSMWELLTNPETAGPHHDAYFFYYRQNELHSILSGDGHWKLHYPHTYRTLNGRPGGKGGQPVKYEQSETDLELYNLVNDVSEVQNMREDYPEIVSTLVQLGDSAREELGDRLTGTEGTGVRPLGRLE
ncbi:MAG: sulfatase [Bacteroidota bacterium]